MNRLEDSGIPKSILYYQLRKGSRKTGRPKFRLKNIIKRKVEIMNIPLSNWQCLSQNRKQLRKKSAVSHTIDSYCFCCCMDCKRILKRCPWRNGYRRRKWTRQHGFKSWTRLIAFHIALIIIIIIISCWQHGYP